MKNSFISMFDLIFCLTNTGNLISSEMANHHKRVAYLAFRIGQRLGLDSVQQRELFLAGLLHDIGAFSDAERLGLFEGEGEDAQNHALIGAGILENFHPLQRSADIIRYHHVPWEYGAGASFRGAPVPDASHILHLADRIVVLISSRCHVLEQVDDICEKIKTGSGALFLPEHVNAFLEISGHEYIWLDLMYDNLITIMPSMMSFDTVQLTLDQVVDLTEVFANIIDFRSPFTARHSMGVAAVAERLAGLLGFSENECRMMLIAGHLHDLGKLAVSNEILEKKGRLTSQEIAQIKSHTFYTYRTLQVISGFDTINTWASLHHERLDGRGYPFHLTARDIPLGSRIMAVADVFTAITEDRPYRKGMAGEQVRRLMRDMAERGSLCPHVCTALCDNFELLDETRRSAQTRADKKYLYVRGIPEQHAR